MVKIVQGIFLAGVLIGILASFFCASALFSFVIFRGTTREYTEAPPPLKYPPEAAEDFPWAPGDRVDAGPVDPAGKLRIEIVTHELGSSCMTSTTVRLFDTTRRGKRLVHDQLVRYNGVHFSPDGSKACFIGLSRNASGIAGYQACVFHLTSGTLTSVFEVSINSDWQLGLCRWLGNDLLVLGKYSGFPSRDFWVVDLTGKTRFDGRKAQASLVLAGEGVIYTLDNRTVRRLDANLADKPWLEFAQDVDLIDVSRSGKKIAFQVGNRALHISDLREGASKAALRCTGAENPVFQPYRRIAGGPPNLYWGPDDKLHWWADDPREVRIEDASLAVVESRPPGDVR